MVGARARTGRLAAARPPPRGPPHDPAGHPGPAAQLRSRSGRRAPPHGHRGDPAQLPRLGQQRDDRGRRHPHVRGAGLALRCRGLHDGEHLRRARRQLPRRLAAHRRGARPVLCAGRGHARRERRRVSPDAAPGPLAARPAPRRGGRAAGARDPAGAAADQHRRAARPGGVRAVLAVRRLRLPRRRPRGQPHDDPPGGARHRPRAPPAGRRRHPDPHRRRGPGDEGGDRPHRPRRRAGPSHGPDRAGGALRRRDRVRAARAGQRPRRGPGGPAPAGPRLRRRDGPVRGSGGGPARAGSGRLHRALPPRQRRDHRRRHPRRRVRPHPRGHPALPAGGRTGPRRGTCRVARARAGHAPAGEGRRPGPGGDDRERPRAPGPPPRPARALPRAPRGAPAPGGPAGPGPALRACRGVARGGRRPACGARRPAHGDDRREQRPAPGRDPAHGERIRRPPRPIPTGGSGGTRTCSWPTPPCTSPTAARTRC